MKTPYYVIHKKIFDRNCEDIMGSFRKEWGDNVSCGYSVKTNNSPQMLQLAYNKGLYAEVVSEQEYESAKEAGFADERILYNGPVKGNTKYSACIGGAKINLDNLTEVDEMVSFLREHPDKDVHLGLRINFDLESLVPGETSTGNRVGRFGICYENGDLEKAIVLLVENDIPLEGLHIHFTTRTRSIAVFEAIARKMCEVKKRFGLNLKYIDIGGGFWGGRALEGKPTMQQYAEAIVPILKEEFTTEVELIVEPGSAMSATVMDYVTTVVSVKDIRDTRIVVVDGSSLHINPFMNSRQQTAVLPESKLDYVAVQEICGATCLEHDRFMVLKNEREVQRGSRIIFTNAGAYTVSLVSNFILLKPPIYVVD